VTTMVSDAPHDGHTTQAGSSMILRQFRQRFGANGSTRPQKGQAATTLSISLSQYGHGCLKVGIVCSYQPVVPEGFDLLAAGAFAASSEDPESAVGVGIGRFRSLRWRFAIRLAALAAVTAGRGDL